MIETIIPGRIFYVTGHTKCQIENDLDMAVVLARQHEQETRQGILVTGRAPDSFTVVVTAGVPYGITQERDALATPARAAPLQAGRRF